MRPAIQVVVVLMMGGFLAARQSPPAAARTEHLQDSSQVIPEYVRKHVERFATREYLERKRSIRKFQQGAYAEVLLDLMQRDGLMALVDYMKMLLQIEYSLNHSPVYFMSEASVLVELPLDFGPSADPWKKDVWEDPTR